MSKHNRPRGEISLALESHSSCRGTASRSRGLRNAGATNASWVGSPKPEFRATKSDVPLTYAWPSRAHWLSSTFASAL
eukprot:9490765-Pyramimonas_sp.AAC.1